MIRDKRARSSQLCTKSVLVAASSKLESSVVTEGDVIASLSHEQQAQLTDLRAKLDAAQRKLSELQENERATGPEAAWKSYAQSLFNLKEFIYLR